MKKQIVLLTGLLFCTMLHSAVNAQAVTLKFNPASGSNYVYNMVTTQKLTQEIMGQKMEVNMNYLMDFLYGITSTADNKDLKVTYQKIVANTEAMGQKMEMSSESDDMTNEANKIFKAMKGASFNVLVSPKGEVLKVSGMDEFKSRIGDGAKNPQVKETLNAFLSEDALKSSIEQSFKFYPDKAVKPGDTWTSTMSIAAPYKMNYANTYTLNKVENGKAFIDMVSKISTNGKVSMDMGGQSVDITLDGTSKGTIMADQATGMPLTTNVKQLIEGNVAVMGQEVPMKIDSDIKISGTKK